RRGGATVEIMFSDASKSPVRLLTAILIALIGSRVPAHAATETIGNGTVKVALIAPLSATGAVGAFGRALRNAAEMALAEWDDPDIQVLVEDDSGGEAAARRAAQQALDDGAAIIFGPAFLGEIRVVTDIARARGVPVIAISDDATAAAPGVYLLG